MMAEIETFISNHNFSVQNGIIYLSNPEQFAGFEALYLSVRRQEGRLYTDEIVQKLPKVDDSDLHFKEWRVRSASAERLVDYLSRKTSPLRILEVGCGNGWLTNQISKHIDCRVYGLDINETELKQAARVFGSSSNLSFLYGNLFEDILPGGSFDVILLASSAQYFSDLKLVLKRLQGFLDKHGEINICDSPFYGYGELADARRLSIDYYDSLGFPQMARQYHHHTIDELADFKVATLHNPSSLTQRLKRILDKPTSPFPWFRITNNQH